MYLTFAERMHLARAEEALADDMIRKGYERLCFVLMGMDEELDTAIDRDSELAWH